MFGLKVLTLVCALVAPCCRGVAVEQNPIRKVVTLMQNMQKEISEEGEKEKELFDKFMCFCNAGTSQLTTAAEDARNKIDELGAKLKGEQAEKSQTEQDLGDHKKDRESAKQDMAQAQALREKEHSEYQALAGESKANIDAMGGAIPALEKGAGGASLVQLPGDIADRVRHLVQALPTLDQNDRREVTAFLDSNDAAAYAPQSGQIVGILKQMKEDMEKALADSTSEENSAQASFNALKTSKESEVSLASQAIEAKTARAGELAVMVVQTQDSLDDTQDELEDSEKFIAQMNSQCATKQKEWAAIDAMRKQEVEAISQAISILNDDNALDVFKKTLPSALQVPVGFLQRKGSRATQAHKAQAILAGIAGKKNAPQQLKLLLFSLNSKLRRGETQNFGQVIKMVEGMIKILNEEQAQDEKQKEFCNVEFDKAEDEMKAAKAKKTGIEAMVAELNDTLAQITEEISGLNQEIKDLDKNVAEATEQRKEEHTEYVSAAQMNQVAIQLVGRAKNRLQKFYNPSLYKKPASAPAAFIQLISHRHAAVRKQMPEAPDSPKAFQKSEKSAGVLGLMDEILRDLESSVKDNEFEEKTAQKDYNKLMASSQASRADNAKAITNKEAAKAQIEGKLDIASESQRANLEDLRLAAKYENDLHISCDFIMENFDVRKEARATEIDSLNNAKAVLSGADLSF